jgi:hypothetical protein
MARKRRPPRPGALSDLAPLPILKKIVVLQVAYYVSAVILIVFSLLVAGKPVNADLILSWRSLRSDSTVGWTLAMVWLLNSLVRFVYPSMPLKPSLMILVSYSYSLSLCGQNW